MNRLQSMNMSQGTDKGKLARPQRKFSMAQKKEITAYIFIAIPVIYFLAFRAVPTLMSFTLSIMEWNLLSPVKTFVGLKNFVAIFQDEILLKVLVNTFQYVIVCMPLMIVASVILAIMLNSIKKGRTLFRLIVFIPYVTSSVAISWVWKWMFMQNGGIINAIIKGVGLPAQPLLNSTTQGIYVVMTNVVWSSLGFNTIILLAGIMQISKSYYEAAKIDGANGWDCFWHITIPQLNPTLVYVTVMGTIRTLQVFTQVYNIAGPEGGPLKSTSSIVLEIYNMAFENYQMGMASAITVILFGIIMLITLFQMKVLNRETD